MNPLIEKFIDAIVENREAAQKLFQKHPELKDMRYIHGETILHFFAVESCTNAVNFLVELGFDVDAPNEFGDSPLIDVLLMKNEEMLRTLLSSGANPNAESKIHGSAIECAVSTKDPKLVRILLEAGAQPASTGVLKDGIATEEIIEVFKDFNIKL